MADPYGALVLQDFCGSQGFEPQHSLVEIAVVTSHCHRSELQGGAQLNDGLPHSAGRCIEDHTVPRLQSISLLSHTHVRLKTVKPIGPLFPSKAWSGHEGLHIYRSTSD